MPQGRGSNGDAVKARIHLIAGARPNFMKIAPLWHALARAGERFEVAVVHTGQHYDEEMSDVFLRQFNLPRPHYALGAGGGSHAEQTPAVMTADLRFCFPFTRGRASDLRRRNCWVDWRPRRGCG